MNRKTMSGMVVATAVVGLLATGYGVGSDAPKGDTEKKVKCSGINACKGQGECAAADGSYSCAGKNECKGKGWVKVKTDKECTDQGGTVMKDKEKPK